jgi:ectoine hydroxylase-related dioxygenase (phytanoyl-CoA dioxygenase family)
MSVYYVSDNDPATAKTIAEQFGFCLVRGVFSPAEIARLERDLATAHTEFAGAPPDLYSCPSLQWLLVDERMRRFAHALLGETIVYYRETNLVYEETPGPATLKPFREFHCDARGSPESLLASPSGVPTGLYPAYRFGIYFRDYQNHSGGLKVAPGSHLRSYEHYRQCDHPGLLKHLPHVPHDIGDKTLALRVPPIELYNVPSRPGDVVIFNLRTFHAAGAVRLRERPDLAVLPTVEGQLEQIADALTMARPAGSRNCIFVDYGAPVEALDFYVKWRALDDPIDLDKGWDSKAVAPSGMTLRNDRLIVALADRLTAAVSALPEDARHPEGWPGAARKDADTFLALCETHHEFSPHHPLFNRDTLARNIAVNPFAAALAAAGEVLAHRENLKRDKQDRALRNKQATAG